MKNIFLLGLLVFGMVAGAQTKLISHKSHSGSNAEFRLAVENDLFDIGDSNFGLGPEQRITSQLDTVIFISPEKSVLVTGRYSKKYDFDLSKADNDKATLKFVNSKKDTVSNNALFSKRHALDSIKQVMKSTYGNDIDKVIFVGFDNQAPRKTEAKKKKGFAPLIVDKFPPKSTFILILLALSIIVGYFSWKTYRFNSVFSQS